MNEASITVSPQATVYSGERATRMLQGRVLASSLRLYVKTGMIPSRGVTITYMLKLAEQITGQKLKRGEALKAAEAVQAWADKERDAIGVTFES